MSKIDSNMSGYLHTYEAYRVPKGTKVQDATGKEVVLSNEEDVLVLTEKASKQLGKDRSEYTGMLQQKSEMAAQKTQDAANEKIAKDNAKVMAVYKAMANGDTVPASDERKLQEYDKDLYQAAKMAQSMAQLRTKQAERKHHASQWDEKEEQAYNAKMKELGDASNEAVLAIGEGSYEFSSAQKENIVEIDSSGVDFSSMKVMSLGSGVTGEFIDLSI
jgi:oligoribonuclease NrnB/cAMP/cGMP phosphodiesterase (DHH superfamily)